MTLKKLEFFGWFKWIKFFLIFAKEKSKLHVVVVVVVVFESYWYMYIQSHICVFSIMLSLDKQV